MFIPLPSSAIADLATSHRDSSPARRKPTINHLDDYQVMDALQPDPLYMGVRSLVTTGLIGRMVERFATWREAREDRQIADEAVSAAEDILRRPLLPTITDAGERRESDLAA